jgi:tellurite resistance-related uncharacterized protein
VDVQADLPGPWVNIHAVPRGPRLNIQEVFSGPPLNIQADLPSPPLNIQADLPAPCSDMQMDLTSLRLPQAEIDRILQECLANPKIVNDLKLLGRRPTSTPNPPQVQASLFSRGTDKISSVLDGCSHVDKKVSPALNLFALIWNVITFPWRVAEWWKRRALKGVEFPLPTPGSFHGVISYLNRKHQGNVDDKGIMTITSTSVCSDRPEDAVRNVADLTDDSYFSSKDEPGQWICWNFHENRVLVTHYTIKSRWLKLCVVEGSLNGKTWWRIDRRSDHIRPRSLWRSGPGLLFASRLNAVSSG